jgi:hypothetical protein
VFSFEITVLTLATAATIGAGAELVYFLLNGRVGPAAVTLCLLMLGITAGWLVWTDP